MKGRLRAGLKGSSLRTRVMAAAALLVALTCLVTGILGSTLLRSYLLGRSDAQLRDFAAVTSHVLGRQHLLAPPGGRPPALPTQFLVEVIGVGGSTRVVRGSLRAADGPRLSAAQLRTQGTPFTAPAAGAPGHSWRVLVQRLPGGRSQVGQVPEPPHVLELQVLEIGRASCRERV